MANEVKHAFVVTSAINSKFGVFNAQQRLDQTLETLRSIKKYVPNAGTFVMDCCGDQILPHQEQAIREHCDVFIDCSQDPDVQDLYEGDNWDIVKNGTEIAIFPKVLSILQQEGLLPKYDRIHKMSGRYTLNDSFNLDVYANNADKIVIGPKHRSQFPLEMTQVDLQYMARLWSWPVDLTDEIIGVYNDSLVFFAERLAAGGYVDIEHVLYKFLPKDKVHEEPSLGVEGKIAPNGAEVKN